MSILETLSNASQGFDPEKDKINSSTGLDSGRYPVALDSTEATETKGGNPQLELVFKVTSGDEKGIHEYMRLSFENFLPDFVLEQNSKIVKALNFFLDLDLKKEEFKDHHTLAEAFKRGVGRQVIMDLQLRENKKNPQYPYRNYEFSTLKEEPFEEELPF